MSSPAISTLAAIERALELFEPELRPAEVHLTDGYLDLLASDDPAAAHSAQLVLNSRLMPVIYERLGHPFAIRMLGGLKAPLWSKEQLLAVKMLGASRGDPVLDIACGPGNFTRTYADVAGDALVVGLDLSSRMLAHAARRTSRPNVAYIRGDACALSFREDAFPRVSCFGAMHMFEQPMRGLDEIVRVLSPGGRVALMTTAGRQSEMRRNGWYTFGWDEITGALEQRGLVDIEQHVIRGFQFVSASNPIG